MNNYQNTTFYLNYICLKLANRLHFFRGDENCTYGFCVIQASTMQSAKKRLGNMTRQYVQAICSGNTEGDYD